MRIDREEIFVHLGSDGERVIIQQVLLEIRHAIAKVVWPVDGKDFIINPVRKGNGVVPIKAEFINYLLSKGWDVEISVKIVDKMGTGPIDAILTTDVGRIAVEWETGNISSSHRALNKMALALIQKNIIGGILIIPIRNLAKFLTDRIGNYEEIEPYFELWQNVAIEKGVLGIIGVDYDATSIGVPLIPKGSDGNAPRSL